MGNKTTSGHRERKESRGLLEGQQSGSQELQEGRSPAEPRRAGKAPTRRAPGPVLAAIHIS